MTDSKSYKLNLTEKAERDLTRLDKKQARRIMKKLFELAENAATESHYALTGQWKGLYRIRIGNYRAIYDLRHTESLVVVVAIGHRSNVYDE